MTLEEHIRRCYSHDLPDASTIDSAEEALVVYRSGYLEGLKDGQHINGEVDDLKARMHSGQEFNRGYAQGISYSAFGASNVALPPINNHGNDYVGRLHAANTTRTAIVAWLQQAANDAKGVADAGRDIRSEQVG